ncbi:MAG: M23 family metallopeptidase [Acidobacteria bacterium]|nr:M23 family metallopeptidase [Acidobacteriota bacterium]
MKKTSLIVMAVAASFIAQGADSPTVAHARAAGVELSSVRPRWPLAREASGQWGVVGEIVATLDPGQTANVTSIGVSLFSAAGQWLASQRYDTPEMLSGMLRVTTAGDDAVGWLPSGTTTFTHGQRAVAFIAELSASRPAVAVVTLSLAGKSRAHIAVPLVDDATRPRFTWPMDVGGRPWIASGTPGTPAHSQGGTLVIGGRLFNSQRFAFDLRQIDADIQTHPTGATHKEDYYAWGQAVRAMARGRVIATVAGDPDFEIGDDIPPTQAPAGNYVVVQHGRSRFSVYAHLQQGSVTVTPGAWVERGQALAFVGNSGHSSEPHLHVHVTDQWRGGADPLASFFVSQGVPIALWGGAIFRDGEWLAVSGATPMENDIIVPGDGGI